LNTEDTRNLLGTIFDDRYIIESIISQSTTCSKAGLQSTTTVYRAHDTTDKYPVVIKHFVPQNADQNLALERFIREARALLVIKHPAIVEIRDVVLQDQGSAFIVMERLEGLTLRQHLAKNGALSFHAFVAVCSQILEALELAHRKGVIHRDLKPDNIIVMQAPAIERIKLIDFGIAQLPGNRGNLQLTNTGDMLGTPLYMSPEQCLGEAIDERSDIYSLGCIMYEMLTGQAPFTGDSILAVMTKKVTEQPAAIAPSEKINQQQIVQFERIINKAMAKAPQDRYQSAQELHTDLLRSSTLGRNKVKKSRISIVFNKFFGSSED
jgi:serine/threonine protein kinase